MCVGGGKDGGACRWWWWWGRGGVNGLLTQLPIKQTFRVNIKQLCQTHTQTTKSPPKEREGEEGREGERERDVVNWVTFNYARVYVCICDAQHSSVTVR